MHLIRPLLVVLLLVVGTESIAATQQPKAPPEQQSDFRPLSERPPQEELPAARLVIAAYSFVMLTLFAYLFSLSKRLGGVKQEIERLERDLKRSPRS